MNIQEIEAAVQAEIAHLTPAEARAQIAILKSSKDFYEKFNSSILPGGDLARATWTGLHEKGYPQQPEN